MAKDASAMVAYRKSKAISKYSSGSSGIKENLDSKPRTTKQVKGEAVTAVDDRVEYEVYKIEAGKEVAVKNKDGSIVTRTGKQVRDKMIYNRVRNGWISKDKGRKYIIRRKS